MTTRSNRLGSPTPRPLSNWTIAAGALVVLAIAAVVGFVLLRRYGGQASPVQLDAIRTAGTLVIGTGGAVALLLTARRQRYTELTLVHTDRDATERRITELYSKAADQLGSDQAPVRLTGLYALERLAHSTVEHRQTMVDVICAYLRMPYRPPPQPTPSVFGRSYRSAGPTRRRRARTLTDRSSTSRGSQAQPERQVRLTAQDILFRNLRVVAQRRGRWWHRTPPPAPAWPGIRLNLTGALLLEFSLSECQLDYADFTDARFAGDTSFEGARFAGRAIFESAQFADEASFNGAQFDGEVFFENARFADEASFEGAQFAGRAYFRYAQFADGAFEGAQFAGRAYFEGAQFAGRTHYRYAQFGGGASFGHAQFGGAATFEGAWFGGGAFFEGAWFGGGAFFEGAQFAGWAIFEGAWFGGGAFFGDARVARAAKPGTVWPPGWTTRPAKPRDRENPDFRYLTQSEDGGHPLDV
ncbi:MAG: pentapeptide repeat-containing protein [Actinomycetota bacterium]|nr:pentapeptide repeat-containing protein [Actinomycetota bacterium]